MTTKQLLEIRRLHEAGLCGTQIARETGLPYGQVGYYLRQEGRRPNPYQYPPRKEYAVYDGRTSALLALGSARECAQALGMKQGTFYSTVSRAEHGLRGKYEVHKTSIEK